MLALIAAMFLEGAAILTNPAAPAAEPVKPPIAERIDEYCKSEPSCVARQKLAAKHYLGIWVMFDADMAQAEACMRAGKVSARLIDWTKAEACMRDWSKGRENIVAKGMKR